MISICRNKETWKKNNKMSVYFLKKQWGWGGWLVWQSTYGARVRSKELPSLPLIQSIIKSNQKPQGNVQVNHQNERKNSDHGMIVKVIQAGISSTAEDLRGFFLHTNFSRVYSMVKKKKWVSSVGDGRLKCFVYSTFHINLILTDTI